MKKLAFRAIVGIIVGVFLWGVIVFIFSDGISDSFSSITNIERASILMEIDNRGLMTVTETIEYRFVKPYRGIYRELPADRAGSLYSTIQITAVGKEIKYIESTGSESERSVRIWFVPYNSGSVQPIAGEDRVTVTYQIGRASCRERV